jgi:hypothetical protein
MEDPGRWHELEKRALTDPAALNKLVSGFRWYRQAVEAALAARYADGTIAGADASALASMVDEADEIHLGEPR